MSSQQQIAILSPFTLANVGLKQLLCEFFTGGPIDIFPNPSDFFAKQPEHYDLCFVTPDIFLSYSDFFLPRKNKTILLSDRYYPADNNYSLYIHDDTENIIEQLEQILKSVNQKSAEDIHEELSPREIEVLQLVAQGYINKEIADRLNISFNTVLTHRKNITAKLGIKTVSGLSFYAMMNGYISTKDIE